MEEFNKANVNRFAQKLGKAIGKELRAELKNTAEKIVVQYKNNMRSNDHWLSGKTIRSISAESRDGWFTAEVGTDKEFPARWLEEGTKPHGPVSAKYLHFYWEKMKRWVKTKMVRGITATHDLEKAATKIMGGNEFGKRLKKRMAIIPGKVR
jgi:hypothetical protein